MDNKAIIFIFLILYSNKKKKITNSSSKSNSLKLDIETTNEKIRFIKKIAPYFPKEHLPSINKAIIITEKILKIHEAVDFVYDSKNHTMIEHIPVENSKERLSYIANTIQKDFTEENIKKLGSGADLILKIDKYNTMMDIFNLIVSDPDSLNNPNKMLKLIEPFFKGKDENEIKKFKEMSKLMNILKALDNPKNKNKEKEAKDKNL